jgi:apolipoprotein D and lipocalin family protein
MRISPFLFLTACLALASCATMPKAPIKTVDHVDLSRFMGDWYVIANIPTFIEKGAYNAIESYKLNPDGTIATTFTFHQGAFDGPLKTHHPRGWVTDRATNATWGMQFIWPIKAEYLIAYLDDAYSETIIARNSRDYVWIMARKPEISADAYQRLLDRVGALGYDTAKVQRVPQRWP